MKKEPLSIIAVKTILAVIIFTGVGTIIVGGGWLIGKQDIMLDNELVVSKDCKELNEKECIENQKCEPIYAWRYVACEEKRAKAIVKQVTITTDETEYEQGETVEIMVRNNLDKSIWHKGSLHNICENAFYMGVKEENYREFHSFSSAYCLGEFRELKPYSNITDRLNPKEDLALLIANENIQFPATYKLKFEYYNKNIDSNSLAVYSNEFTIEEKSALDPRCSDTKVVGELDYKHVVYMFNEKTGKCFKKVGGRYKIETPFKTLEEC